MRAISMQGFADILPTDLLRLADNKRRKMAYASMELDGQMDDVERDASRDNLVREVVISK